MKSSKKKENVFSKNLNSVIQENRITQRDLAKVAGVSASTLNAWLSGSAVTDMDAVMKICDKFDCSFSWLLTGKEDKKTEKKNILNDLFDYESVSFNGLYEISARKLVPKKTN